ncbi:MAG: bactofilin family protein [Planctomycetota bacterium]|jgi:cytoskeletal protein CcmA (bactofilin family)
MADANTTTVIGADTTISGEMSFGNSATIHGKFDGKINAKGELHVADGASCTAAVEANSVFIDGIIKGDVNAADKIQLNPKARLAGDIVSAKLVVAEGASFTGHCTVGPDAQKQAKSGTVVEVKGEAKETAGSRK